jgi:hypothetical protein
MNRSSRRLVLGMLAGLLILGAGCAKPKYEVTGKITRDGKPLEWQTEEGVLLVTFVPMDRQSDRNLYRAETDRKTGKYTIAGVPRGSYRVFIQHLDPPPAKDMLELIYGINDSPITKEVTGQDTHFDIDLPKDLPKKGAKS